MASTIRNRRQDLGLTQEELAWRAGLHRTYVADVERGVRNVTLRIMTQLARAVNASAADLLSGAPPGRNTADRVELGEVLLVEDNVADAEMTQRAFRAAKLRNPIRVARDGLLAMKILFGPPEPGDTVRRLPQVVLLDLHLPKISGLEVLRRIRKDVRTRALPVTVLTISRRERDIAECQELGIEHYITKPVTTDALATLATSLCLDWGLLAASGPGLD